MHNDLKSAFSLAGRVAVVTGGASGIGRETAYVLAQAGARVLAADISAPGLAETVETITANGGTAAPYRTDVASHLEIEHLADAAIRTMERIDIWVNAAGVLAISPILDALEADLERLLAINLKGVFWGCAAAGRTMKTRAIGSIINISSGGGESPVPGLSIYSMTKAGVNMLTRTAACEFGPFGIRVNAIAPGWIDTPINNRHFLDENGQVDQARRDAIFAQCAQASPLGLTGTPRDVALAVLYLASDASAFVTGQILRPNGGVSMP